MTQLTSKNSPSTDTYTLSIQVSLNGLSFCTTSNATITHVEEDYFGIQLSPQLVLDKIKYTFDKHPALQKNFSRVEVIYQNTLYTTVPKALFTSELLKEYLQHTIKVLPNDFIAYDELEQHEMVIVYIPYTNINNFFFETFGSFTYKHTTSVLIDQLLLKEKNTTQKTIYAHMTAKSFDLIVFSKGKLLLCNSYNYETAQDFIYYLIFTAEQLQFNPETFLLQFLGDIRTDSDCYKIATTYIRHVQIETIDLNITPIVDSSLAHKHFILLSTF